MKKNIYDFITTLFTSDDEIRPALTKPGLIDDFVYATDAHTAIKIKAHLFSIESLDEYSKNLKFPKADVVFNDTKNYEKTQDFRVKDLLMHFYNCQLKSENIYEDCDVCDGAGEVECKCCGNDAECKNCDGSGHGILKNDFGLVTVYGKDIFLLTKKLNPAYFYRVIHVAMILNIETLSVKYTDEKYGMVFTVGDIEILIMSKV